MRTEISIQDNRFYINNKPTYEGISYMNNPVQGLLFNSRMVQAVFDDENPETRKYWAYPDTGRWDPDRNTDEFCEMLKTYRDHGLLAVTVGLQGGGSIYSNHIYEKYINTAFTQDGELKESYFKRLYKILKKTDEIGMVVIINYFYKEQVKKIKSDSILYRIIEKTTERLLDTGFKNILIDLANESDHFRGRDIFLPGSIHKLIEMVKQIKKDGRSLITSSSTGGRMNIPADKWIESGDFILTHGNSTRPHELKNKLKMIRENKIYRKNIKPIVINEDSIFIENLMACLEEYVSWGFYCQGYGSDYQDLMNWKEKVREGRFGELSGFQTLPVNWGINTKIKKAFFDKVKEITQGK